MGDPITISDGSGGDPLSKYALTMDKEVEAAPVGKRTPWPIGLHSVEERRKLEEEERKGGEEQKEEQSCLLGGLPQEAQAQQLQQEQQQQLQEEQPQLQWGEWLEE